MYIGAPLILLISPFKEQGTFQGTYKTLLAGILNIYTEELRTISKLTVIGLVRNEIRRLDQCINFSVELS